MPLITKADLGTHLYTENIDIITRQDDTIVTNCIKGAESEAKGYLSKFNLVALFGTLTESPTIADGYLEHLKQIIKDITAWNLAKLGNPNMSLELLHTSYKDAIKWLMMVQSGIVDPEGWEYKTDDSTTAVNESATIQHSSNPKQSHHF